ncbi:MULTISPECIES: ABC transporter permease [Stenotrophomonas]|uniref:ABC transporter permease n=1 Tax=Stenotrophomonas TaxID=40323 RepID=UPI0012B4BBD7|nr:MULTISPECIES: FtsX-like permease family protein [Stenotrophomonas]MBA0263636.1 FtsX-like permease family protein [Stenotrophomonas maltophilia]MBA0468709.1 FtsX-like permease family protein [Stenotrophomonas maltophilia]MBA0475684.1 FtsX-like permease family protein [Stenotrophomonas maltophilia]MBA0483818.1 FtsX-like permease family protein [Stenotrophomonas maltophilia]MBO0392966.1 ABC transporter permease [Stenotrophomonas maltophilia]
MDVAPIVSAMRRHKIAVSLIVLEIALSCAIICNLLFLINERLQRLQIDSGVAETELIRIQAANPRQLEGGGESQDRSLALQYLATLRAVPGVNAAALASQVPFSSSSSTSTVRLSADQQDESLTASVYLDEGGLLQVLGTRLIAGRNFNADEYRDMSALEDAGGDQGVPAVIINRSMAEQLFPGRSAIGQSIFSWGTSPTRVVGVVEELIRPNGFADGTYTMILPVRKYTAGMHIVARVSPALRGGVLQAGVAALRAEDPNIIIFNSDTLSEMRSDYFRQDRAMAVMLSVVVTALLIVTALGIVGLASFWVQQRTRQIGIRRALGARRVDILAYFQTENFLITSAGITLGMLLAYAFNLVLMKAYELSRMPWYFLPAGALLLWILGQLAVLGPARRASQVSPAVATRGK